MITGERAHYLLYSNNPREECDKTELNMNHYNQDQGSGLGEEWEQQHKMGKKICRIQHLWTIYQKQHFHRHYGRISQNVFWYMLYNRKNKFTIFISQPEF